MVSIWMWGNYPRPGKEPPKRIRDNRAVCSHRVRNGACSYKPFFNTLWYTWFGVEYSEGLAKMLLKEKNIIAITCLSFLISSLSWASTRNAENKHLQWIQCFWHHEAGAPLQNKNIGVSKISSMSERQSNVLISITQLETHRQLSALLWDLSN